ncbi:alpha-L-fucosidase [Amycolatopsis sp. NPDC058278]|uniref:alpha-L-fucosidase n=1 Tax=Amycolatopsis sp. NPDC058278 TaxID=3346417 RepID=UPI0036DD4587
MTPPAQNPFSRRQFGALAAAGLAAAAVPPALAGPAAAATPGEPYQPTWPSVDRHPPAPEWFQDAKFGIYWHWGAFTTPEFGSEWYGRNMYIPGSGENKHHKGTYGDPAVWGYDRFIDGGTDVAGNRVQFAPKLGGPRAAPELAGPVRQGHPRAGPEAAGRDAELWLAKLKEVIDRAKPDVLWQDFSLNSPGYCINSRPTSSRRTGSLTTRSAAAAGATPGASATTRARR